MPEYTTNYSLYKPNRLDETIEVDTSLSDNFTKIDTEIKNRSVEIGTVSGLTTATKTDVVSAINEHDTEIGTLSSLTTTDKTSLVASVNEHDAEIGTLTALTTTAKTSLVTSINEHDAEIGVLTSLTTTDKTNLVAAINELDAIKLEGLLDDTDIATGAGIKASKLAIQKMYKKSAPANPSATADTFGVVVDLTPPTGYTAIYPLGILIAFGGTFSTENVTADITVTFSDATTATITKIASSTNTTSLATADLLTLSKDDVFITKLSFKSKSSIASSTVTVTLDHYGFYL